MSDRKIYALAGLGLLLLTLVLYGDVLVATDDTVISHYMGDASQNHSRLRALGFDELQKGNIPLWNPYIFSGTPFLGSFQASLLYPSNVLYFLLPIHKAMNADIALHVFLIGFFMFAWCMSRRIHPLAAFYAGTALMFGSNISLRVLAGQINVVTTLVWVPLLFMAADKIFDNPPARLRQSGWTLVGVFATSMQIFAGYPQVTFMTAFFLGIYVLMRLASASQKPIILMNLAVIAVLPVFIGAIQLWTGVQIGYESIRTVGGDYRFATSFSFPPENLLTLFVPSLFGDRVYTDYWGRWTFWDVTLFVGITTFVFAVYGACFGDRDKRRFAAPLALFALILALGRYSPIYSFFYHWVPPFDSFRAPSKFLFFVSLFVSLLAGAGIDRLLRDPRAVRKFAVPVLTLSYLLFMGAIIVWRIGSPSSESDPLWRLISYMKSVKDTYVWWPVTPEYLRASATLAFRGTLIAATTALLIGVLLWSGKRSSGAIYALVGLGILEVVLFARVYRDTFSMNDHRRPAIEAIYAEDPGDYRILDVAGFDNNVSNHALEMGQHAIWGYDPIILRRYGDFVVFAGVGPEHYDRHREIFVTWASDPVGHGYKVGLVSFTDEGLGRGTKFLGMLRCRYIVRPPIPAEYTATLRYIRGLEGVHGLVQATPQKIYSLESHLPRFVFVSQFQVIEDTSQILLTMDSDAFDPAQEVILESEPNPLPAATLGSGSVMLTDSSTDHMDLEVELSEAAILLVTDAYAEGWRAVALPGSVQQQYEVLPANLALRAIPLAAGTHRFRLEYAPLAYRLGKWVTPIALLIYAALIAAVFVPARGRRGEAAPES